jgi:hypothetical protein
MREGVGLMIVSCPYEFVGRIRCASSASVLSDDTV